MSITELPDPDAIAKAEEQGLVFSKDKTILLECTNKKITEVVIPNGVIKVAQDAFDDARSEEQVKRDHPHLFAPNNDFNWVEHLIKCPLDACKCHKWDEFDVWDWCSLLSEQPKFAERCHKWDEFDGGAWSQLLCCQMRFAERCDWSKLDGEDWSCLLEKQPQFAEKRK